MEEGGGQNMNRNKGWVVVQNMNQKKGGGGQIGTKRVGVGG